MLVTGKVYAPIFTNIISISSILINYFLADLQYFDDKMDDLAFHIVNFPHIWTCTLAKCVYASQLLRKTGARIRTCKQILD